MSLATLFEKTWKGLEAEYSDTPIEIYTGKHNRNQAMLVAIFCKLFNSGSNHLHATYDARNLPDKSYRPNFIIWNDEHREPQVVFMGDIKYKHQDLIGLQQDIGELIAYTRNTFVEVLTSHDSTDEMKVAPDIEPGYFVVGEFEPEVISHEFASLNLPPRELARFHFAYGSIKRNPLFEYMNLVLAGVNQ